MARRMKISFVLMLFVISICLTAKLTSDAVKEHLAVGNYVETSMPMPTESPEDPMVQFRTERQQLRQMQKAQLNDIIYNSGSDGEIILSAQTQLMDILKAEADELAIEGMLQMRGFQEAIVSIDEESANILVRSETLSSQDAAIILEHIVNETGISPGNVKIIPIN